DTPLPEWMCDLLPCIFDSAEWETICRGVSQRLRAFELFLRDIYSPRSILRSGAIPIHAVLGSAHYQSASIGVPRPGGSYLHLGGICLTRDDDGRLAVKDHYLSHGAGISYMMQNRRALARVVPEIFHNMPVRSLAETPLAIIERLHRFAPKTRAEPAVVLLSPGIESPVYSEHSFLARRMGIPLVQGGDLLAFEDAIHLKTVQGLKRVDVIYNFVPDAWIDPLVFRKDSSWGVPGLVHCLRKGSVTVVNALGSELVDDRTLLCFASKIIRYYLNEEPILPTVPTFWMGDIDQREMVMENLKDFTVLRVKNELFTDDISLITEEEIQSAVADKPACFVAQRADFKTAFRHEHIVFVQQAENECEVFPGALTRVFPKKANALGSGWISKDTWILGEERPAAARSLPHIQSHLSQRQVTSRVAEAFYWIGRYLERGYEQAYLIQSIETLETEELNAAERKLYRPMWDRLLPPIEKTAGESRRSITNRLDRYRLLLLPNPGTVLRTFTRAMTNAQSIQECLSPEAWSPLSKLRAHFERTRYKEKISEEESVRVARRLSESVTQLIPQFFATAAQTMLADEGWKFCKVGQMLERAIITANSLRAIHSAFVPPRGAQLGPSTEIELSAFLRLLGTRDAYRRVYQMRAEPVAVLEFLWQNPEAPRSIFRCMSRCESLLRESLPADTLGGSLALEAIDRLLQKIKRIDWKLFVDPVPEEESVIIPTKPQAPHALEPLLTELLNMTLESHHLIADGFLNHQTYISHASQPRLAGF
ncbi:MAG: circularly permuted type 2 ATP-grasp protein, partial [Verrucomicrobiota bacterium]|nr:circularly permuted type 2 ATP-grasp protein [Verrucomicrobiota bacterium]